MTIRTSARKMHTEAEQDALAELGNVAFSHAATALSNLVGRRVDITLPVVTIMAAGDAEDALRQEGERLYIITLRILGDQQGVLALVLAERDALALADMLEGSPVGTSATLTTAGRAVLTEVANIMSGSALLAMYRLLRISLIHSTPSLSVSAPMANGRLHGILDADTDVTIVVDTEFSVHGQVARGKMVISFSDLDFFIDALMNYAGGGAL